MDWITIVLEDGRQRYNARTAMGWRLHIYDWANGRVDWSIDDATGNIELASGRAASVDQAKREVERALEELGGKHRPANP